MFRVVKRIQFSTWCIRGLELDLARSPPNISKFIQLQLFTIRPACRLSTSSSFGSGLSTSREMIRMRVMMVFLLVGTVLYCTELQVLFFLLERRGFIAALSCARQTKITSAGEFQELGYMAFPSLQNLAWLIKTQEGTCHYKAVAKQCVAFTLSKRNFRIGMYFKDHPIITP